MCVCVLFSDLMYVFVYSNEEMMMMMIMMMCSSDDPLAVWPEHMLCGTQSNWLYVNNILILNTDVFGLVAMCTTAV